MQNHEGSTTETHCNPDAVYVPSDGWWCKNCGVFRSVDDTDTCDGCRVTIDVPGRCVAVMRKESIDE
jgi:hypothetical protein